MFQWFSIFNWKYKVLRHPLILEKFCLMLVSLTQLWLFWQRDSLHSTRLAGIRWDPPFSKWKEGLCSGACRAHWKGFKLDMKGEGEHIRLPGDKLWGDTQWLEGRGASMGPQPVAQKHAGDTAAQLKSCRNELGAPRGSRSQQGSFHERPQGKQGVFLYEGDMANSPDEMPLHEHTQHGKQTGRAGSYHAARKLWLDCHYWNLVGQNPWLECGYWWLQVVQQGQEVKEGCRLCPPYQEIHRAWRAVPEE